MFSVNISKYWLNICKYYYFSNFYSFVNDFYSEMFIMEKKKSSKSLGSYCHHESPVHNARHYSAS